MSDDTRERILITGGAGFIGSHLAEYYLRRGRGVTIIDDLSTGSLDNVNYLRALPGADGLLDVHIDTIFNQPLLDTLVARCGAVFHLAAAVGVRYILENPLSSISTNVLGTDIVLKLANKHRRRVLITSTSEAYGKQSGAPLREDDDVVLGSSGKARWSYAVAKLMDEFAALAYHRETKLPVVVVRLFNTVGPRQSGEYGMVVPRFVQQALRDEPITVYGDGTQSRTFTHVGEVCAALAALIDCKSAYGEVVNVGGVEEVTILELARRVVAVAGSASDIRLVPYSEVFTRDFEDMQRRVPCTDKLRTLIGFAPEKSLDGILHEIVQHFMIQE